MENYVDRFAFIKVLVPKDNPGLFADGMQSNYNLEEEDASYKKFTVGASWQEFPAKHIDELNVGQVFFGISKSDSMSREYLVIAKDKEGHSVWYPMNGPESAIPVVIIYELKDGQNFTPVFTSEMPDVIDKMTTLCEPGKFYVSTTVNGELIPIFGTASVDEEDEDDWDWSDIDDDEEDEDLVREEEEFATVDCVFTCVEVNGIKKFISVSNGLMLKDEVEDVNHQLQHAKHDVDEAQKIFDDLCKNRQTKIEMQQAFDAQFEKFQTDTNINMLSPIGNGLDIGTVEPENVNTDDIEPIVEPEVDFTEEPGEEVKNEEEEHLVVMTPLLKKLHEEENTVDVESKGDTDGDPIPSPATYLPKDDEDLESTVNVEPEHPSNVFDKPVDPFAGW